MVPAPMRWSARVVAGALLCLAYITYSADAKAANLTSSVQPTSDEGCYFNYAVRRCEPVEYCAYRYRFLDATLGESCRLKGEVKIVRPIYKSKIMGHPLAIAGGAAALFATDIMAIVFTPLLQRFPLSFNIVQGFILCVAGDTLFQVLEQGAFRVKEVGLNAWRAVRSGMIGSLNNGLIHYLFYKWIDKRFPYHVFTPDKFGEPDGTLYKLSIGFVKWLFEFPTIGVYKIVSMMAFTAALGGDLQGLPLKLKKRFLLTWLRSLQVWPIYDTLLYAYVPASHRPLFNTCMSLLWSGYLSSISQPEAKAQAPPAAAAAAGRNKALDEPLTDPREDEVDEEDDEEWKELEMKEGDLDDHEELAAADADDATTDEEYQSGEEEPEEEEEEGEREDDEAFTSGQRMGDEKDWGEEEVTAHGEAHDAREGEL